MPKVVELCRTVFLAFFYTILHNKVLSIGANAFTYMINYFLPPYSTVVESEWLYGVAADSNITV